MIRDFDVKFDNAQTMDVSFSERDELVVDFGPGVLQGDYDGPYEVIPNEETQTLATAGKSLNANVIVKPIPSNYGLITWDGATLTVS